MTNTEAITKLTNIMHDDHYAWHPYILAAFGMAVDALKGAEGDCISRQMLLEYIHGEPVGRLLCDKYNLDGLIEQLPSAQPEHCGDMVSRNAIIQKLNKMDRYVSAELRLCDTDKKFPQNEVFIVDDVYEEIVEQLPSVQPEQRWIPCSERLPEQYGNYLVSYRTDDFESDIGTFDPDRINSDTGEWSACDANGFYWVASKGLEVIAWMPLPEPYRAKRRTDE